MVNRLLALKTNIEHWRSNKMQFIDKTIGKYDVKQLDLQWSNCELLKDDKNHFTLRGLKMFIKLLIQKLVLLGIKDVHVISDSTIAWWNYDNDSNFNNVASDLFIYECRRKGINASINAINGAGFRKRYDEGLDFPSLLNNTSINSYTTILIIGGWNDESVDQETIESSINKFMRIYKSKIY